MPPLISVILVNYNQAECLGECLSDLMKEAEQTPLEVMVIDNASTDGSPNEACRAHAWVNFRANPVNLGFARACNQGLREASGGYLMLLNPDTRLKPGALASLARFMAAHPQAGAVGPKILDPDGGVQYSARRVQGPGAFLFNRYSLLTRLWPTNPFSRRYLLSDWDHASPREVDWLSGAALMVRREVLDAVGLMDEAFFLFHEDVDFCQRIKAAGFKVMFCPEAEVIHAVGISKHKGSIRLLRIRHQSMIHYVHKHHRRLGPLLWLADLGIAWRFGLLALGALLRRAD